MNSSFLDIVVIGAGHAGLSISYYLNRLHINHLVFEKGRIGNTWRRQRWNSFKFNTPIKVNLLPGHDNTLTDAEGFWTAREFVSLLEDYTRIFQLPVLEGCEVLSVDKIPGSEYFSVAVSENGAIRKYQSRQVVVASGSQNRKLIPSFSEYIPPDILQLHAGDYKNSSKLPHGAVLVAGSAQSGVQIAEDLIDSGKKVFLSTGRAGRMPRRYRGKDIIDWLMESGYFDVHKNNLSDPLMLKARFPQISGVGKRGHTISLQSLAGKGAVILGKAVNADSSAVYFQPDAADNLRFADEVSAMTRAMIDRYIQESGAEAPEAAVDPADIPDAECTAASPEISLNLKKNRISAIIWATGFRGDFSYLKLPVFDHAGQLIHNEGISDIDGLYFLGLPWMRKRKSGIILGIREDSEFITRKILLKETPKYQ